MVQQVIRRRTHEPPVLLCGLACASRLRPLFASRCLFPCLQCRQVLETPHLQVRHLAEAGSHLCHIGTLSATFCSLPRIFLVSCSRSGLWVACARRKGSATQLLLFLLWCCFAVWRLSQKFGSPVLNLDYLLHDVVERQRPLDWEAFWEKQAAQVRVSAQHFLHGQRILGFFPSRSAFAGTRGTSRLFPYLSLLSRLVGA